MLKNICCYLILIILLISTEIRAAEDISQNLLAQTKLLSQQAGDIVLGNADAKLTLIEYSSLTCYHCADFHKIVFPELKTRFIDSGKLKYIQRNFPMNKPAVDASVFLECVGGDRYYLFLKVLYEKQDNWATSSKYLEVLENIAKLGGFTGQRFHECISNKALQTKVAENSLQTRKILKLNSTPSFYLNGEKYTGSTDLASFVDLINKAVNK